MNGGGKRVARLKFCVLSLGRGWVSKEGVFVNALLGFVGVGEGLD